MPAAKGFFTDTSLCIGCKACEVACKQWNQLPEDGFLFTGMSYDNTVHLGASTWRHVAFIERPVPISTQNSGAFSWLMSSDVCKHCARAGCLEACPTGAIIRTEFDSVYVQPDICNGCGYCIVNCPFGVIDRREEDGRAWKCTLCYDRLRADMTPACAKACPTESIQFGDLNELRTRAQARVEKLQKRGVSEAYLYGADEKSQPGTGGLNAFFLLLDKPEVYNLPPDPVVPTKNAKAGWTSMALAAAGMALVAVGSVLFNRGGERGKMIETRYKKSLDPVKTDGRDIDPALGHLSGEAAQQIAGPAEAHIRDIARTSTPEPEGTTYYGRPMLNEPVWKWAVPLYYYTGGAAGASLVIGAAAQFDRSGKLDDLVRRCHGAGIIGIALSSGLLVLDLGRPSRFLNMLRVFRPTSPMSVGAWILCAASPAAIIASLFAKRRGLWGWIGEASGLASGIFGLGLATYTGVLVGNSAIPLWQESRRLLPVLFGASAMSSAGSLFDLFSEDRRARRITYTFGTVGRVAELAAAVAMEKRVGRVPLIARPLKTGASGMLWKTAAALTAGSLIATLLPHPSRKKRIAAGVLGTLGSLMLRYAVHQAGVVSARDPRAVLK